MEDPSRPKKTSDNKNPKQFREKLFKEGEKKEKKDTDKKKTSLRKHKNPFIRTTAQAGYTVWLIVMGVGLLLAFIVSLFLL